MFVAVVNMYEAIPHSAHSIKTNECLFMSHIIGCVGCDPYAWQQCYRIAQNAGGGTLWQIYLSTIWLGKMLANQ